MHYEETLFRPPSEARSLILQAAIGCSHNRCAFCGIYKTKRFRIRDLSEIRADILEAKTRWPDTRRVFLADGDAMAFSGRFPQDKERLISEIENALNGQGILREEWERGL